MKILIYQALGLLFLAGGIVSAAPFIEDVPKMPDTSKKYLFYLHGAIIEQGNLTPTHPEFGYYDMPEIRSVLADHDNLVLISEHRPKGTQIADYAKKLADDVNFLIKSGVAAEDITISGFSKGGMIAILTSSIMQNKELNFIFMAACNNWAIEDDAIKVAGRILSIFETTDTIGRSCAPLIDKSPAVTEYKEVEINTGKKHGAFYEPVPEWVEPLKAWIGE